MMVKRYHTALVALHWLLALLMLVELGLGSTFLKHTSNDIPEKLLALRNHMVAGGLILILTITRLVVRLQTTHPAPAYGGRATLDRLARAAHYGLYLLPALMAISGLVLAAPHIALREFGQDFTLVNFAMQSRLLDNGADLLSVNGKGLVPVLELKD